MGCGVSSAGPGAHAPHPGLGHPGASGPTLSQFGLPQASVQQVPRPHGGGAGASGARGNSESLKAAPTLKSLVRVGRESVTWSGNVVSFSLDCSDAEGCDVTVLCLVQEQTEEGSLPSFGEPSARRAERFPKGLRQTCRVDVGQTCQAAQNFGEEKDGYFHLVLDVVARTPPSPDLVTRCILYARLDGGSLSVVRQKSVAGQRCATVDTLYGSFAASKRTSQVSKSDAAADGTDCVICLTNARDVVILPCRHLCLCSTCAGITSSTWSFQCPVCRARVSAMVQKSDAS
eukprot:TRINITY_DN19371_c0_g5_i1.p1 TRINITY_DN19371_c0_g5~~TRINITY_DN19371_c0_g5_i1.p1  ORF type:complete len:324 (+),score=42.55 TRINITY_DN19371_c0_g5_i1:111-974(+)